MQAEQGFGGAVLEEMLEPVSRCLGMETARALSNLQLGKRLQARVGVLAEKCNAGLLATDERAEYEA